MNTFEKPPHDQPAPGRKLTDDATRLFDVPGDDKIQQRVDADKDALDAGDYDKVCGPSLRSLKTLLEIVSDPDHDPADIAIIREKLPELVANAYGLKDEIIAASQQARENIKTFHASHAAESDLKTIADQLKKMRSWWTPYGQFVLRVGAVNDADQKGQLLEESNFSFRPFNEQADPKDKFINWRIGATGNALLYNIVFNPNHTYRDWDKVEKLVQYAQQQLGT